MCLTFELQTHLKHSVVSETIVVTMVSSDLSYIAQSLSSYTVVVLEGVIALKWSGVGSMGLQMRIFCI